jgi:subtilase family serine protease
MRKTTAFSNIHQASAAVAACLLLSAVTANAAARPTLTAHVPPAVASGQARLLGTVDPAQRISLAISLPLRNEPDIDRLMQQIYDPQSSSYHHYLTVDEFARQFGPSVADHDAVVRFAAANGLTINGTRASRMVVDIEGPVANIEKAFHVSMGIYQHPTENRTFYAPDREPTLDLAIPVLHISGLDNFTLPHPKNMVHSPNAANATGSGPHGQFIGSDMRAAYYGSGPLTGAGQSIGLFEFAGYEISDVQTYFTNVNQPLNVPVTGVSVNGASLSCPPSSCDDSEQALDIEMSISMAPGLSNVYVYVGKTDASIFAQMASDDTANQLSCSWGWSDNESTLDPIFKELAVQGQTVFVASGDDGSGTPGDVVWPADDPYVTSVGGTDLVTNGPGGPWQSETGWSGSAGGASKNNVAIPSYQLIPGVINTSNDGSTTLRNYPDVAAEADTNQYSCYDGGCYGGNGGTSYAAPQWAGFAAMLNEQGAGSGEGPIGFLNPTLYHLGVSSVYDNDFHDITSGSNGKYTDVAGYDLVTGWGSFIGPNLIDTITTLR